MHNIEKKCLFFTLFPLRVLAGGPSFSKQTTLRTFINRFKNTKVVPFFNIIPQLNINLSHLSMEFLDSLQTSMDTFFFPKFCRIHCRASRKVISEDSLLERKYSPSWLLYRLLINWTLWGR